MGGGGAGNIEHLCRIAKDLGFKKVAAIFDGDKAKECDQLREKFSDYQFEIIPADDVRTKSARKWVGEKQGLLDAEKRLQEQYREELNGIFDSLNGYLRSDVG